MSVPHLDLIIRRNLRRAPTSKRAPRCPFQAIMHSSSCYVVYHRAHYVPQNIFHACSMLEVVTSCFFFLMVCRGTVPARCGRLRLHLRRLRRVQWQGKTITLLWLQLIPPPPPPPPPPLLLLLLLLLLLVILLLLLVCWFWRYCYC